MPPKTKLAPASGAKALRRPVSLWKSAQTRRQEREAKRMAVLSTAAHMFLEQGPHRVSMNDIAEQLGITKPALYNYFGSKDEILLECFRRSNSLISTALDTIEKAGGQGLAQLREFIQSYASLITVEYGTVMTRIEDRELPDQYRGEVRRYKRGIDARVRAIILRGIEDGSIVRCDVKLATFAILGALNWIGQWFRSDGPIGAEQIGREYARRLTDGLTNLRY